MIGIPAFGTSAPSGLRGVLRAWLQGWLRESVCATEAGMDEASQGRLRVLVVDDNPVNRMVISAMMESRGIVPLLAADGAEAVALACELHFDLILMDMLMPILDGLGAISAIRRFETESARPAVPVVAYSSVSLAEVVRVRHGLNGSLMKPCGDQDLDDCLLQWCPTYRSAPFGSARSAQQAHREHRA